MHFFCQWMYKFVCLCNIADDCNLQLQEENSLLANGCFRSHDWRVCHQCICGVERDKSFQRSLFLEQLGKVLVSPHMKSRKHLPSTPASVKLLMKMQDHPPDSEEAPGPSTQPPSSKRKCCEVCPRNKDVKSKRHCTNCRKNICIAHTINICQMCMNFSSWYQVPLTVFCLLLVLSLVY